ncbi:SWIM zinc finger family protein [Streptomyces sp. NBC_00510]
MSQQLPPVAPAVTAELVGALSPRLRKRLDAGVAKLAARPVVVDGDTVRIAVDDDTDLELHAPGGTVTRAEDVRCGCLLAPDCLHRAAAASAAPVAEAPGPAAEGAPPRAAGGTAPEASPGAEPETATPQQHAAADALRAAGAAVLDAGIDGSGAVVQAELLRAAHSARLSGLPRAAAAAVSVVTRLRAARAADPGHRLADLAAALRELLGTAHRVPYATGPELAAVRGTARQPYTPDGSLRLYGLFSEPVLTASGYAGAVTWTADADGRLYTVSDVAPGGPGRATGAADRAVRIGDTALSHRELSRAGLAVSGATVSPTGRLGAGAAVRAVRAPGAAWTAEPLDRLWRVPVAEQAVRALSTGDGLLFLDVTLIGTVREAGGDCLLAECDGLTLRLAAAHDHPALPHRDNLRLLAGAPGISLRVIARLDPAPHPRALLLATSHPADLEARVDTGLDRLQRADLPAAEPLAPLPLPPSAAPDEAPVHLLLRRVHQAASGGRRVLALPTSSAPDARRLRRAALPTAADLLEDLHRAAADRGRDSFGRLLPADTDRFALAWLAAAVYADELSRALCAAAWGADPSADPSTDAPVSSGRVAGGPV